MAAATSTKPALSVSALKTPLSATYPSELRSPMLGGSPVLLKRERDEDLKTPITPPIAYMDFLKNLSPALMSPLPTGTSSRFAFPDRPSSTSTASSFGSNGPTSAPLMPEKEAPSSPTTISSVSSASSRASSCCNCDSQKSDKKVEDKPKQITIPPPSPFNPPLSARSLRRLQIPQSPYSPRSPMSARSVQSPYSAAFSPREIDDKTKPSSTSRAVVVRSVVTRTVTYSRTPVDAAPPTPLDPAPKGKRRRIE